MDQITDILTIEGMLWFPLKLIFSFALGSLLGIQRSAKQPIAGVRTHMIVSCGSCLIAACGLYLGEGNPQAGDASRLAGQIVTGIGFIGAGVIISRGVGVMTSAATLFMSAGIGIACGLGFYAVAIIATLLVVAGLHFGERFFPYEEVPGKSLHIICANDKVEDVLQTFKGKVRLNSLAKHDDKTEIRLHFMDLSWYELDKLVLSAMEKDYILSIQLLDIKGGSI